MDAKNLYDVIAVCYSADENGNPSLIFDRLPENTVWQHSEYLISDAQHGPLIGPTLLHAIYDSFNRLANRAALQSFLIFALSPSFDEAIYEAAQSLVLGYAPLWDAGQAKQFYFTFEEGYRKALKLGRSFVALQALEGAVMLSIFRDDDGLMFRAMGTLLSDFPPIPDDIRDPAFLPVKALKLLGRCYDARPNNAGIAEAIKERIGVPNVAVDAEARFNYGVVKLYEAFRSTDSVGLRDVLMEARDYLRAASVEEENRTDADLFAAITDCYLAALSTPTPDTLVMSVRHAQSIALHRLLALNDSSALAQTKEEYYLVCLTTHLQKWIESVDSLTHSWNIGPPLSAMANVYAAIRSTETSSQLANNVRESMRSLVMLPMMRGQFAKARDVGIRLSDALSDPTWRSTASTNEIEFLEMLLREVERDVNPKGEAAKDAAAFEGIVKSVARSNPGWARRLNELYHVWHDKTAVFSEFIREFADAEMERDTHLLSYGPVRDIYDQLVNELNAQIMWPGKPLEWHLLKSLIRVTVKYFVDLYNANVTQEESFLFAKDVGGLGIDAAESNLEEHFYKATRLNSDVDVRRQPAGVAPGRPDLMFHCYGDVNFPIEVKCESIDVRPENLRHLYLAQAQSYTAAMQGVGFLFVLDTTPKQPAEALRNMREYCYVDSRPAPDAERPDLVIVFIFPANRYRPSDHTRWSNRS